MAAHPVGPPLSAYSAPIDDSDASQRALHFGPDGPVAAAYEYLDVLLAPEVLTLPASDTYAALWALTDEDLRYARAQAWLWNNRTDDAVAPHVNDDGARALAASPSWHALWPDFAHTELFYLHKVWGAVEVEHLGAASATRVIGLDLELVILADTRVVPGYIDQPILIDTVGTWVLRRRDRWRLASHSDFLPEPGWPPKFKL
jgi:hypothetical protein